MFDIEGVFGNLFEYYQMTVYADSILARNKNLPKFISTNSK